MKDTDFYVQILGLKSPWFVEWVKLETEVKKVTVRLKYKEGTIWACPETQESTPGYDHVERKWRHLDTCGFETTLECAVPRVRDRDGKITQIPIPWAEAGSRFTSLFERFAVSVIESSRSLSAACKLTKLSWDQLQRIMERAVARGLERRSLEEVSRIGIDEKSFAKGQSYMTLVYDIDRSRVLEVVEGADQQRTELALDLLGQKFCEQIDAVCIDMSKAFEAAIRTRLTNAEIVHDRFHISAHLNDGVAQVHRAENKKLQLLGDERLKGTQRLFGYDPDHFNDDQAVRFEELRDAGLKTSRAWLIKETFRHFWTYTYEGSARKFFKKWFGWASRSQLKPIIKVAKMIRAHFEKIITYLHHGITNAVAEGMNSKIQSIKAAARGFQCPYNYRTRILFFCGKLDLYPQ